MGLGVKGRIGVWGLSLGAWCALRSAAAAPPGQAFRLEYWADGRCPDAIEFAKQIQTRAPSLRPAEADEPALGFYVELVEHGGVATGRLTARSTDGREVVREVRGPTCDDVSTALALIAALAADPGQSATTDAPVRPSPPVRPTRRAPNPDLIEAEAEAQAKAESPTDPADRWTFGVGPVLTFDSTIAPSPGYGLGIAFEAESPGGSPLRSLLSLSAIRAAASNTETGAGTRASFTWVAFRGAYCPVRWPEDRPLFFRPCAFADIGVLGGSMSFGSQFNDVSHTWLAGGAFGRIEALAAEVVSFQLDGGLSVPLLRPTFGLGEGRADRVSSSQCGHFGPNRAILPLPVIDSSNASHEP